MTISYNLEEFRGKPVRDYDPSLGVVEPENVCYRIRVSYEQWDAGTTAEDLVRKFGAHPNASKVHELVIGVWDYEGSPSTGVRDALIEIADAMPLLEGLMFGDITYEESEISWIENCDLAPLVMAYAKLHEFRARGGSGLELDGLEHYELRKLVLETGGMSRKLIADALTAKCPKLEHLELWLGVEDYGFDATIEDLGPAIRGDHYPKLRYLGLRNAQITDEIAKAIAASAAAADSLLTRLEVLDLSMGTLTDEGAAALSETPELARLEKLDLHHHYVSEAGMQKLRTLDVEIDLSSREDVEDDWRYPAVSE